MPNKDLPEFAHTLIGRRLVISVPGSTTNLGPGFDAIGLALNVYSRFSFFFTEGDRLVIDAKGSCAGDLSDRKNNLLLSVLLKSLQQEESDLKGLNITIETDIPLARGLGSSSTAVLSALWAAEILKGRVPDRMRVLSEAAQIEGHPDNVAASLLGGLVVCAPAIYGSKSVVRQLAWPEKWKTLVVVPPYKLSTEAARAALPKKVPLKDATANVQRAALFVAAVAAKDEEALRESLIDNLHEPYRASLVPDLNKLKALVRGTSGLGCVLSGAGSSVLIITHQRNHSDMMSELTDWCSRQQEGYRVLDLDVDTKGLRADYESFN
ncbi:MAG: homoserine kinase [Candidatus Melainabacteria bacterium]|nr:homoserine kinase [Candidatus Melainabacteria bacterium]